MIELMSGIDIILPMMEWFWKGMLNIGMIATCVIVSYNSHQRWMDWNTRWRKDDDDFLRK